MNENKNFTQDLTTIKKLKKFKYLKISSRERSILCIKIFSIKKKFLQKNVELYTKFTKKNNLPLQTIKQTDK